MRKKLMAMVVAMFAAVTANAQFEEDKVYVGGSLTGFNMKYTGSEKFSIGTQAQAGYFVADDLLLLGQFNYDHSGKKEIADKFSVVSVVATTLSRTAYILA